MDTLPLLLSPTEAYQQLGVSRSKLWELLASGELPSVKIGRSRRIKRDALLAYVAALEPCLV
jgi:excisionase family DNA binding protein